MESADSGQSVTDGSPGVVPAAVATTSSEVSGARARFCGQCGTAWEASWTECLSCAAALSQRVAKATSVTGRSRAIRTSLALYFALLCTHLICYLFIDDEAQSIILASSIDSIVVIAWAVACRREVAEALKRLGPHVWSIYAAGLGVLTFVIAMTFVNLLVAASDITELSYTTPFFESGYGLAMILLMICVQPAIIEELAFRGIILGSLRSVLGTRDAVIVSALMFMIIHLSVASFPHLFIIGLVLAYLRVRTGSLYPGMILHFVHNFLCVSYELMAS